MRPLTLLASAGSLGLALPLSAHSPDRYAHQGEQARGTALLFHDLRTGAQEYAEIAPRLAALGFEVVAADLRIGYGNRTYLTTRAYVNTFDDGIPDAQGVLAWARQELRRLGRLRHRHGRR